MRLKRRPTNRPRSSIETIDITAWSKKKILLKMKEIFENYENLIEIHCGPSILEWSYYDIDGKEGKKIERMYDPNWRKGAKI